MNEAELKASLGEGVKLAGDVLHTTRRISEHTNRFHELHQECLCELTDGIQMWNQTIDAEIEAALRNPNGTVAYPLPPGVQIEFPKRPEKVGDKGLIEMVTRVWAEGSMVAADEWIAINSNPRLKRVFYRQFRYREHDKLSPAVIR